MALSEELKQVINDPASRVILSAVGKNGQICSELGIKVRTDENGRIRFYELLESSQMQKHLVYSLWFDKKVTLLVINGARNFHITGTIYQAVIAGYEFESEYEAILNEVDQDADLSTVWLIDVEDWQENTYQEARERQKREHPLLMHMDHIYKEI